jgi:hypothetical protein
MSALRARRSANILVCGFTELSSSVFLTPAILGGAVEKELAPSNPPHAFAWAKELATGKLPAPADKNVGVTGAA